MTSADSGESIFTATTIAGQALVGTAPLTYNWSINIGSGSNALTARWEYRVALSGGAWTAFATAITGSDAEWYSADLSGYPGEIAANQSVVPGAGTWECRLVGAKNTSSGNGIHIESGTATLSLG
jgi:hypothetical protein